jgi:hypothetical protein
VARAKQTDRAEARRRHRVATRITDEPDVDGGDGRESNVPGTVPSQRRTAPSKASGPATPQGRVGITSAFRGAYRPLHLRDDLALLPQILLSRGFLAAAGLVLAGAIAFAIFPGYSGSSLAWEYLVVPGNALAPVLVAGFFAPRASYLLGFIVGLLEAVAYNLVVPYVAPQLGVDASPVSGLLLVSLVSGSVSGMVFASVAAWYRRFLALSSPRRNAPARGAQRGRPAARAANRR